MGLRRGPKLELGQQLGFLGRLSTVLLGGGLLVLFLVWKQVECGRLRAGLFDQQGRCASLLAENEQLRATQLGLCAYRRIHRLASDELGMIVAGGVTEWITVAPLELQPREGWPLRTPPPGGYACAR